MNWALCFGVCAVLNGYGAASDLARNNTLLAVVETLFCVVWAALSCCHWRVYWKRQETSDVQP